MAFALPFLIILVAPAPSSAASLLHEDESTSDLELNGREGSVLLQTMHSRVVLSSPANESGDSLQAMPAAFEAIANAMPHLAYPSSELTMADMYQHAFQNQANDSKHSMSGFLDADSKTMASPRQPREERTLGDIYQQAFQGEAERNYPHGIPMHAASPKMKRVSAWISGFTLAVFGSIAMFGLVSGWSREGRPYQNTRTPKESVQASQLLERCVEVDLVPSGTLCVVCLEGAGEACKEKEGLECTAGDGVTPPAQPLLEGQLLAVPTHEWCRTPCGHSFHRACLECWLNTAVPGRKRCPVCNSC